MIKPIPSLPLLKLTSSSAVNY